MSLAFDAQNAAARKKLRAGGEEISDSWEWFRFEKIGADILVEGCETRKKTRGKNKGERVWFGSKLKVIVTASEMDAERIAYERETGNCSQCCGDGQEWAGWNRAIGNHYRPCHRCGGTGKAKV